MKFMTIGSINKAIIYSKKNKVLNEKLLVAQLVKKFSALYGSRRFSNVRHGD